MTDRKQEVWLDKFAAMPRLNVTTRGVTPSWKVYGDGAENFSAYAKAGGKRLNITAAEHAYGDKGRVTTKQVSLTLDEAALVELRDLINTALA
jgi:hypothetical protein